MGAWGPGIFSDDAAADIRDEYRALIVERVPDDEATRQVVESFMRDESDPTERHVLWLALAAAQSEVGRLDTTVRDEALRVIDNEEGLELWTEAGPKSLQQRRAALEKLRQRLTGPQPKRKVLRGPRQNFGPPYDSGLDVGDLLVHRASGTVTVWLVLTVDLPGGYLAPQIARVSWDQPEHPNEAQVQLWRSAGLPSWIEQVQPMLMLEDPGPAYPDWGECDFERIAAGLTLFDIPPEPVSPDGYPTSMAITWSGLVEAIREQPSSAGIYDPERV